MHSTLHKPTIIHKHIEQRKPIRNLLSRLPDYHERLVSIYDSFLIEKYKCACATQVTSPRLLKKNLFNFDNLSSILKDFYTLSLGDERRKKFILKFILPFEQLRLQESHCSGYIFHLKIKVNEMRYAMSLCALMSAMHVQCACIQWLF